MQKGKCKMETSSRLRRLSICVLPLSFCLAAAGCNIFSARPEPPDAKAPPVPSGDTRKPTPDELVSYLNREASRLQSIDTRDLSIDVRAQGTSVSLDSGVLLCQKPRYFKLVGKKFGSQEVLVGSNEERFWFYVKRDPSDALFHCSYTDFDKGAVDLPFPFEPEWVLEALGMAPLPRDGSFRVDEDKFTYRLIETTSLRGQTVRKVTVFHKGEARLNQPQVKARMMYDAKDRLICAATIKSVSRIPLDQTRSASVTCPQIIKLEWPAQQTELILDLGRVNVNGQLAMEAFQMPHLGNRQVDLGRDRPTGRSGVVPARFR
jgi:hypothetical protein